jgi:hypothetical protein
MTHDPQLPIDVLLRSSYLRRLRGGVGWPMPLTRKILLLLVTSLG